MCFGHDERSACRPLRPRLWPRCGDSPGIVQVAGVGRAKPHLGGVRIHETGPTVDNNLVSIVGLHRAKPTASIPFKRDRDAIENSHFDSDRPWRIDPNIDHP